MVVVVVMVVVVASWPLAVFFARARAVGNDKFSKFSLSPRGPCSTPRLTASIAARVSSGFEWTNCPTTSRAGHTTAMPDASCVSSSSSGSSRNSRSRRRRGGANIEGKRRPFGAQEAPEAVDQGRPQEIRPSDAEVAELLPSVRMLE